MRTSARNKRRQIERRLDRQTDRIKDRARGVTETKRCGFIGYILNTLPHL